MNTCYTARLYILFFCSMKDATENDKCSPKVHYQPQKTGYKFTESCHLRSPYTTGRDALQRTEPAEKQIVPTY